MLELSDKEHRTWWGVCSAISVLRKLNARDSQCRARNVVEVYSAVSVLRKLMVELFDAEARNVVGDL
ncbi:hypothetical protein BGW36DRAFT_367909 [Talaromyces proteolyticus]|uniref:Uncharacterized protein n=1 Tax=Talaromyces proteolyticus TaxID=1131652 RepID=A0AAD4Q1G5_9EURO|nr:uncharacterized protein BGW36DRAFT_367909 [Talaromyces proteolyticus]KAH8705625.1 hypothetical protein BGW36DRAFT_367909 [Talaromyces proteolyticus]